MRIEPIIEMTNNQALMTREFPITNSQEALEMTSSPGWDLGLGHCLGISHWTLVIFPVPAAIHQHPTTTK